MDELQSPLSFVRGSSEERNQFIKSEDKRMSQSFGADYKSTLTMSSFYSAKISPPVPSKRTRHLNIQVKSPANKPKHYSSDTQTPSPILTRYSVPPSPSPSISSVNSIPTPISTKKAPSSAKKRINSMKGKDKKTIKSPTIPQPTSALTPAQSMLTTVPKKSTKSKPAKKNSTAITNTTTTTTKQQPLNEQHSYEDQPTVPLPLSRKLPVYIKMSPKDKEKEYWRRQRRVFVHSRFVTNEEGVVIAKTVYSNLSISPSNRMITSFQGNIANFRTKLRKSLESHSKVFNMSKEYLSETDETKMIQEVTEKVNTLYTCELDHHH